MATKPTIQGIPRYMAEGMDKYPTGGLKKTADTTKKRKLRDNFPNLVYKLRDALEKMHTDVLETYKAHLVHGESTPRDLKRLLDAVDDAWELASEMSYNNPSSEDPYNVF